MILNWIWGEGEEGEEEGEEEEGGGGGGGGKAISCGNLEYSDTSNTTRLLLGYTHLLGQLIHIKVCLHLQALVLHPAQTLPIQAHLRL